MNIVFFKSANEFRRWLSKHHAVETELIVGFYKKNSGKKGITYEEAVDEALCFGWIDGIVRRVDDSSYSHRFTPRKPVSIWSLVNLKHIERLTQARRMMPSGIKAFEARLAHKTGIYAFEQKALTLDDTLEKKFRANKKAWEFWEAQPPGYRRLNIHRVMSAKQAETRERRLAQLIAASLLGERIR